MIEIKNLNKYYNKGKKSEQHVLNGINLELGSTGLVCILGESGSGKTTLLNTIGGLDTFSDGSIKVEGIEFTKYDPKRMEPIRNDRFDYIFQNYYLLPDYSVAYNVKLALNRFKLTEQEKEERADYVLNMLGMGKFKKKLVSKLSGGQRQRVSIARALVKSPDIILADEPTGNLDEENTLRTMSILKSISKECLVILVTHEKRIAKFFGDRIIEICDGKIVRDAANHAASAYERSDDSNIYLKEMDCKNLESDFADFKVYYDGGQAPEKISLNLAWKDGKIYIQNNMECDILLEGQENGVQMLDEERPKFDMDEIEKVSYNLEKPASKGTAHLAAKEIWRMALENIRLMGKKQAFIIVILLVTAVLLSVSTAEFVNTVSVDEQAIIETDSHYVQLKMTKVTSFRAIEQRADTLEFIRENMKDDSHGDVFFTPDANLYLVGFGFIQMKELTQAVKGYSFVPVNKLKEENLVAGKMPGGRNEIVIDRNIINKLKKSTEVTASLYKTEKDYLDKSFKVSGSRETLKIVGISDTEQPAIYCRQNILVGLDVKGDSIADAKELKEACPEECKDIQIADDEMYVRKSLFDAMDMKLGMEERMGDGIDMVYKIAGTFPDSAGADFAFSEKGCQDMRDCMICERAACKIYTQDKKASMEFFGKAAKKYMNSFKLEQSSPYDDELKAYKKEHSINVDAKKLITLVIVAISLLMVYFMIKSNAMSRIGELTVYRLLGISKSSILKAYILEMALMTCYTSVPAVLVTSVVIKFVSSVPSLGIAMIFPWWSVLILLIGIFLVHTIISILPIYGILSKPPATLAVKD
ncbi:MAG: ABC transporter ATP-binding protein/permease [Lachnospiraceae bacterium]|nr:ABC transporter ATP-binding protein/permease [Lachnospiraceae bacterium]